MTAETGALSSGTGMQEAEMDDKYLSPTAIVDSEHPSIVDYAGGIVKPSDDPVEKAVKLYYAVRDDIWYDPYYPFHRPEHYRSSNVLKSGRGYCVSKASLLCALGRTCDIPARVGFATVRNHLATRQLVEYLGSDLFVYHGYVEFFLEGKWVRSTPAFNAELCRRQRVNPLEFNGREDSLFQPYNSDRKKFMEYVEYLGVFSDIPVKAIVEGFKQAYGKLRVEGWIDAFEKTGGNLGRNFYEEDVVKN